MKQVVLFRHHKEPEVCINRLKLLHKYNKNLDIYGIYGGEEDAFFDMSEKLGDLLTDNYCLQNKSPEWKWKNFDLAVSEWYRAQGKKLNFDQACLVEWDIIMLDSISNLYQNPKPNKIFLTGLTKDLEIKKAWKWSGFPEYRKEYEQLVEYVSKTITFISNPYICLGPGALLSKDFIETYSQLDIPLLCNDEARIPMIAEATGYELQDNGFQKQWFNEKEYKYFNCLNKDISLNTIISECSKRGGRKVFHPYREILKSESF